MVDLTMLPGTAVILPNGRVLGTVYDVVIDTDLWSCTHLYIREPHHDISEKGVPLAIPWRWIRAVNDVILLRWFPDTPLPFIRG